MNLGFFMFKTLMTPESLAAIIRSDLPEHLKKRMFDRLLEENSRRLGCGEPLIRIIDPAENN